MPFFDFRCADCGRSFELMLRIDERDGKGHLCPECGSNKIERQVAAPRIAAGGGGSSADCGPSGFS